MGVPDNIQEMIDVKKEWFIYVRSITIPSSQAYDCFPHSLSLSLSSGSIVE